MLLNPFTDKGYLGTLGDGRLLESTFGVIGQSFPDPSNSRRVWTIHGLYSPVSSRRMGGVRARLIDGKDFVTFVNQRDLEVLLGVARPGQFCPWSGKHYVSADDREWYGLCADEDDLLDDLYDRELLLRASYPNGLPDGLEITRRVHLENKIDCEELLVFLGDFDPETGACPDPRFETVGRRWARAERTKVLWERVT